MRAGHGWQVVGELQQLVPPRAEIVRFGVVRCNAHIRMRFERSTRPKIMAPLRGVALRTGPTRGVEILPSTAPSVGMRLYNVRTPNVRDTAGSGIREKKQFVSRQ